MSVPETPAANRTGRLQFVQAAVSPTREYRGLQLLHGRDRVPVAPRVDKPVSDSRQPCALVDEASEPRVDCPSATGSAQSCGNPEAPVSDSAPLARHGGCENPDPAASDTLDPATWNPLVVVLRDRAHPRGAECRVAGVPRRGPRLDDYPRNALDRRSARGSRRSMRTVCGGAGQPRTGRNTLLFVRSGWIVPTHHRPRYAQCDRDPAARGCGKDRPGDAPRCVDPATAPRTPSRQTGACPYMVPPCWASKQTRSQA